MANKCCPAFAFVLTIASYPLPAGFAQQFTWRASVNHVGEQANGISGDYVSDISGNGRYVVYMSTATNMVPGGSSSNGGIYRFDRELGTSELVNINQQGNPVWRGGPAAISGDGRFVTFSASTGPIWVRDMVTAQTEQASVTYDEQQPNGFTQIFSDISSDGRYVVFNSGATNLVSPPTTNSLTQVYVRDRVAGTTILVSQNNSGVPGNEMSYFSRIRGHQVLFYSQASNLVPEDPDQILDVYVRNLDTGTIEVLPINSVVGDLSDDGRWLLYADANAPFGWFLRDRTTQAEIRVDLGFDGSPANGSVQEMTLSGDGRFVTFYSDATNLLPPGSPIPSSAINNVYVRDLASGTNAFASPRFDGNYPQSFSAKSLLADETQYVTFIGWTSDLVLGDTNGVTDVFLRQFDFDCISPHITTHPFPQFTCVGQPLSLSVAAAGAGLQYQWSQDGVDISGASQPTYSVANATLGDAGLYAVRVFNECGPVFGIPVQVTILTDMNADGVIDLTDLATLLANFGRSDGPTYEEGDLDGDGIVSLADLAALLSSFGLTCV
jgi:hypothetical protein